VVGWLAGMHKLLIYICCDAATIGSGFMGRKGLVRFCLVVVFEHLWPDVALLT
jgi:hypothetical protein